MATISPTDWTDCLGRIADLEQLLRQAATRATETIEKYEAMDSKVTCFELQSTDRLEMIRDLQTKTVDIQTMAVGADNRLTHLEAKVEKAAWAKKGKRYMI